jgi:hypothetical protein
MLHMMAPYCRHGHHLDPLYSYLGTLLKVYIAQ